MAAVNAHSAEVSVHLKALTKTGDVHPDRRLTLSKDNPVLAIGRSSRRRPELEPSSTNAFFDCPVMSRNHAELHLDTEKHTLRIQDTGSLHGTLHNKVALRRDETRIINSGDIISFGLPIDRGADSFTPQEVEAMVTWPTAKVVTYRVPDDTDVEEISDGEDNVPEHSFARNVLRENSYRVIDHRRDSINLLSPILPPISSFDIPPHSNAFVDLTSDESSQRGHFESSVSSHPTHSSVESLPQPDEHRSVPDGVFYRPTHTPQQHSEDEDEDEDSCCACSDEADLGEAQIEISDDEDSADFDLSEAELSDEEAEDLWGLADDGSDAGDREIDDVAPESTDHDILPQLSLEEYREVSYPPPPGPLDLKPQTPVNQPTFAPADFAFKPDVPNFKFPDAFKRQANNLADKSDFFKAREENRKTLGLPLKDEHPKSTSKPDLGSRSDDPNDLVLNIGPRVNMTNELLSAGDEFLNEPLKNIIAAEGLAENNDLVLDETSAYQFQMSKKAVTEGMDAKDPQEKVSEDPESTEQSTRVEETKKPGTKRKIEAISESTPEELEAVDPKPEVAQVKETLVLMPPINSAISNARNSGDRVPLSSEMERPAKRLRRAAGRAAEVVGYAAIGGLAVMSALIATAPQL